MAKIRATDAEAPPKDGSYTTEFNKWNGYVEKIPLLKGIINAGAASTTASWRTTGSNDKKMAQIMDTWDGQGNDSFRIIMDNLFRVAKTCGDSYAEILTNDDMDIENLLILPSDNISQVIKNGIIKRYDEMDGNGKFKPPNIFHLAYNKWGSMTHGTGVVPPMENLLQSLMQVQDDMAKIFHKYIKPLHMIKLDTDDPTQQKKFKAEWQKLKNLPEADFIFSGDVQVDRVSIPQGSILDPMIWERAILKHMFMGSRTSELTLGTGSVNSEESAKMQMAGFRGMIRWDQKWLADNVVRQLFTLQFPENPPGLTWSFATEPQEEAYNRHHATLKTILGSDLPQRTKSVIGNKLLLEMGLIKE